MANQITDNRTLVDNADSATPYDNLSGTAAGTLDTDVKIQGTGSIALNVTNTRAGLLFDAASAQNWSNNVFYVWINCGIVGLLDTKVNGGFTIRFCGATVSDFIEFYVGGNDSWPVTVEGGWAQFVVDVEATPSNTGGTPPATSAIRYVGFSAVTASVMTKMVDNTWIDESRRLPDGTPGVIIEGRDGGSTDWDWADVVAQLGVGVGTVKNGPGGSYVLNTPIQFGINDTTTHGFTDTNQILLWEDQEFAPTDLYSFSALGNSGGTTNVTWGVKTGTGDAATGAQGLTVSAASGGVRWGMDFDDPNLDGINFYGCVFQHGGGFQVDDPACSLISTTFLDCTSARVDNAGDFLRCKIISANTGDGVPFITTDDLTDIVFCEFEFSDGHALELTTPRVATQASKGNKFTGYGVIGSNDAAVFNNSGGAVVINVTDSGDTPTFRNGSGATTTVNNNVTLTLTVRNQVGDLLEGINCRFEELVGGALIAQGATNGSGQFIHSHTYTADLDTLIIVRNKAFVDFETDTTITVNGFNVPARLNPSPAVNLP